MDTAVRSLLHERSKTSFLGMIARVGILPLVAATGSAAWWWLQASPEQERLLFSKLERARFAAHLEMATFFSWDTTAGNLYYEEYEWRKAKQSFDQALKKNPRDADALLGRAKTFNALSQSHAALADIDTFLKIKPNASEAFVVRGDAYFNLQNYENATTDYKRAIAIHGQDVDAQIGLIRSRLASDNDEAKAIRDLLELYGDIPKKFQREVANVLGQQYLRAKDYDRSVRYYSEAIDAAPIPMKPREYIARGIAYEQSGKFDAALSDYNAAIDLTPKFPANLLYRGLLLRKMNRTSEALSDFDEVIRRDPNRAMAWESKAHTFHSIGKLEEAINCYEQASKLNPNSAYLLAMRGNAEVKLKRFDEAILHLTSAAQIAPQDARYLFWLGQAKLLRGMSKDGFIDINKARQMEPDVERANTDRRDNAKLIEP